MPWQLASIAIMFLLGTIAGVPRLTRTLGRGMVPLQPPNAVVTELSSGVVVLGAAAVGSPVSMTQALSGALVGSGVTRGHGRIRWGEVARIVGGWLVTFPAAFSLAVLAGLVMV